jgi:hypothetical protein
LVSKCGKFVGQVGSTNSLDLGSEMAFHPRLWFTLC